MEDHKAELAEAYVSQSLDPTSLFFPLRRPSTKQKPEILEMNKGVQVTPEITSQNSAAGKWVSDESDLASRDLNSSDFALHEDEFGTQTLTEGTSSDNVSSFTADSGISEVNIAEIEYVESQTQGHGEATNDNTDLIPVLRGTGNKGIDDKAEAEDTSKYDITMASAQTTQNSKGNGEGSGDITTKHVIVIKKPKTGVKKVETREITLTPEELETLESKGEINGVDVNSCVITVVSETTVEKTVVLTDSGNEEVLDEKEIGKSKKTKVEIRNEDSDTESSCQGTTEGSPFYPLEETQDDRDGNQEKNTGSETTQQIIPQEDPTPQEITGIKISALAELSDVPEMEVEMPSYEMYEHYSTDEGDEEAKTDSTIKPESDDIATREDDNKPDVKSAGDEECKQLSEESPQEPSGPSGVPLTEEESNPPVNIQEDEPTFSRSEDALPEFELFKSCIMTKSIDLQGFMNFPAEEWVFVTYDKDTNDINEQLVFLSTEFYTIAAGNYECCTIQ